MMSNSATNNTGPVLPGNMDATTRSPDNLTRRNGKHLLQSTLCHAVYAIAFGSYTTLINQFVVSQLNQPRDDFLAYHCFNNLSSAERNEYTDLTPYAPAYLSQVAVASTSFFLATGGLCKLYEGCKSIYDRACTCFSRPDATANQPAGDYPEANDEVEATSLV
ncbi:hypothetical protein J7438_05235 [Thalassotalea sp. G20_0]|uniref:hypothetical protein n=1 Tax=Thalassotalea sp. G20_0 TaxID=2821093 RepID=UPI001ADBDEB3|nr:hypothetical protein [Thalassotalea sp. G20_0]MBO9493490.1 hypothetical protein [Thalassotalea sp. G20_0]